MMLRWSLNEPQAADLIEGAVAKTLDSGLRTADIAGPGDRTCGTTEMGVAIVRAVEQSAGA
jgi:3-isopropylmalate dehydrogenase